MALLNISIPPGVVKNGTEFQQANAWNDANLVRWYEGSLQPIGGWRARTTTQMSGVARAIINYRDNSANRRTVVGTNSNLYFIAEDQTVSDITPAGFTTGNANATQNLGYGGLTWNTFAWDTPRPDQAYAPVDTWSLANFGENVIACSTSDGKLYEWANSASSAAALLSNAPTNCTAVLVTDSRQVMALGANGVGAKVAFSDQEQTNVWTPASTNAAGSQILQTNGNLILGKQLRGETLLLTTTDAHVARFQGPPFIFGFQQVGTGCGAVSANACVVANNAAYWMGKQGFFVYNGSTSSLRSSVGDFLFEDINESQSSKVFGVLNSAFHEIIWFYPSSDSIENDRYVIYNYRENTWSIGRLARTAGVDAGVFNYPNYVSSDGYVYEHEAGYAYDSGDEVFAETGPIQLGNGDRLAVARQLISDETSAGAVTATFKTRNYPTATESTHGPFTLTRTPTAVRFQGRQIQMRVTGAAPESWRVGTMRLDVVPGSAR